MYANTELPSYKARQRMIARMLRLDDKNERWVTLKNGVHICLDLNDNITKGPDELVGKNIKELKETKYAPVATEFHEFATPRHQQHMIELGYRTQRDYEQAAVDFYNSDEGELFYGERRDRFYRYDTKTEKMAVCDKYGRVLTLYKSPRKYFNKVIKQEGLK